MIDKTFILELIKIISPYIVAIIGILSPIITIKYLNSQDLIKFKKQKIHDFKFKIYPQLISELNELKRILEIIVSMAESFEEKKLPKVLIDVINENMDKKHLNELKEYTLKYDSIIFDCRINAGRIFKDNFPYLNEFIIQNIDILLKAFDSTDFVFNWGIPLNLIKKEEFNLNIDNLKSLYINEKQDARSKISQIDNLISLLKCEISGEK